MSDQTEIIAKQASEIERLRFALYGCLVASKEDKPLFYTSALAIIQREAHTALYGRKLNMDVINRPVAMEAK